MAKNDSILDATQANLSPLNRAVEMQKHASKVGFDWLNIEGVIDKIIEEINEVKAEASIADNHHRLHDEIGDLLFACTNLARHLNVNPEEALHAGNNKFYQRFIRLEQFVKDQGLDIENCSLDQLNQIWNTIKHQVNR